MNNVVLTVSGNVGEDPELRITPSGKAIVRLRVAVDSRRQVCSGEWADGPTSWYTVIAWERLAERLAVGVAKGDRILVHGRLAQREYLTEAGERRSAWEITADDAGLSLRQIATDSTAAQAASAPA